MRTTLASLLGIIMLLRRPRPGGAGARPGAQVLPPKLRTYEFLPSGATVVTG